MPEATASGIGELVDRHLESTLQLVASLLNGHVPDELKLGIAASLEAGGRIEVATLTGEPVAIDFTIVLPSGSRLALARYRCVAAAPAITEKE